MMINLNKSQKIMIAVVLSAAVFGGLGLWWYWSSGSKPETVQRPTPTPAPVEEKKVEIIKNLDGSGTFYNYTFGYKFTVPEGWEDPRMFKNNPANLHLSHYDSGIWTNINIQVSSEDRQSTDCQGREKTTVIIAGQEATKCDYRPLPPVPNGAIFYLNKDNLFYTIIVEPVEPMGIQPILSSFEFLNGD